jgi:cyclohexanone monooxygenase
MSSSLELEHSVEQLHKKYLEERDKRRRAEGPAQYIGVEDRFAKYADDPHVEPGYTRDPISEEIDVLVVGGGFSGLLTANALVKAGLVNFRILEKAGDFGGTWYWNRYPDCRCDVESYIYLPLMEDFGDMPAEKYSRASAIFEHAKKLGRELKLYDRTYFQTAVTAVRWNEAASRWIVKTDRDDAIHARFVCLGSGGLHRQKLPGVIGIESFKGHSFHTSRWDYAYTGGDETGNMTGLKDKKVAVIGTGATGVQCIPPLGQSAQHLYVVQRTPAAVDARNNRATDQAWWDSLQPGWWEHRAANFDGFLARVPQTEDLVADGWTTIWARFAEAARLSKEAPGDQETIGQLVDYEKMGEIRARIQRIVKNPVTAAALQPWYNWFCKRPLFHDGYYETFNRDNVTLINTDGRGLDRITENALVFDGKSYEVDCLVFASGFEVGASTSRAGGFELIGRKDMTLDQKWQGGRQTLHGMFVRGFPNLGIIFGAKHATATWNVPYTLRKQAEHFVAVVKHCADNGVSVFDVAQSAETRWGKTIVEKSALNIKFVTECTPGYFNNEGKNPENSIFGSLYGGGPFEYFKIIEEWRRKDIDRDLEMTK